jgi:hypothetical protein
MTFFIYNLSSRFKLKSIFLFFFENLKIEISGTHSKTQPFGDFKTRYKKQMYLVYINKIQQLFNKFDNGYELKC